MFSASGEIPVVVRTREPNGVGRLLTVSQVVTPADTEPALLGPDFPALSWWGTVAMDYVSMAQEYGDTVSPYTTVLPAVWMGGMWIVKQRPRFEYTRADNEYRVTDCLPFGAAP